MIRKAWLWLLQQLPMMHEDIEMQQFFARGAVGMLMINIGSLALTFGTSLLLSRWLGADGYGSYQYLLSWILIFAAVGSIGADELLMKEYPAYEARGRKSMQSGLVVSTTAWGFLSSVIMGLILWGLFNSGWYEKWNAYRPVTYLLLLAVPLLSMLSLSTNMLLLKSMVLRSQFLHKFVRQLIFLSLIGIMVIGLADLSPIMAIRLWVIALAIVSFILTWKALTAFRSDFIGTKSRQYEWRRWSRQLFLFFLLPLLNVLFQRTDYILIMHLLDSASVGIYNVSARLSELVALPVAVFQIVFVKYYSQYYESGKLEALQKLLRGGARFGLMAGLPVLMGFILLGKWILGIYGDEFTIGYSSLLILAFGQWIFLGIGSLAMLLMMTGHSQRVVWVLLLGFVGICCGHLLLIPVWGMQGAAVAKSVVYVGMQLAYAYMVHQQIGIWPTAFEIKKIDKFA